MSSCKVTDLLKSMDYNTATLIDESIPQPLQKLFKSNKNRKNIDFNNMNMEFSKMSRLECIYFVNNLADKLESEKSTLIALEQRIRHFNKKDAESSVEHFIANLRYYGGDFPVYGGRDLSYISVGITVQEHSPLPYLGSLLGSTLINANQIIFNPTGVKILSIIYFIEATMKELRFPENNIFIHYGPDFIKKFPKDKTLFYYCGDQDETPYESDLPIRSILRYSHGKIPMLVFNTADLDSASHSAIQAVWGFQGMMPWCVNNILVQEDVFDDFVTLLKEKLKKVKIPEDVSAPRLCKSFSDQFKSLVSEATKRHLNFWTSHENQEFSPLIVIGDVLMENNVIEKPKYSIPFATILPFRNTAEAVALANNSRQGLAASVWSENIGLINEVCRKLKVGTVWINAHGQFRPEVSFVHQKSGYAWGCLNGMQAILQNEYVGKTPKVHLKDGRADLAETLGKLKAAQAKWSKLSEHARKLQLRKVALIIENNLNDFGTRTGLDVFKLKEWISLLMEEKAAIANSICDEGSDIKSFREPIGSIAMVVINEINTKFIISAVADGNSLILFTEEATNSSKMVKEIEKYLPGIIKCVDGVTTGHFAEVYGSKYIDTVFIQNNLNVPVEFTSEKSVIPLNDNNEYRILISKVKNVWYNFGDSFS